MPAAQYAIGACYADGEGVSQDILEAYKWIALASTNGHNEAKIFMATLDKKLSPEQKTKAQQLVDAARKQL